MSLDQATGRFDQAQEAKPKDRRYVTRTGEQFFTPETQANTDWSSYYDPFLAGGADYSTLAGTYASTPVVSGYEELDPKTGEWAFTPETSLYNNAQLLQELESTEAPQSFDEWLGGKQEYDDQGNLTSGPEFFEDIFSTEEYKGITDIIDDTQDLDDELAGADEAAAARLGFFERDADGNILTDPETGEPIVDVEAYQNSIAADREQLDLGVLEQPGLYGTDYEYTFNRATARTVQSTIQANRQLIESLGMQSSAAAYMKMAEVSNQIANINVQAQMVFAENDLLQRQAEYDALFDRFNATSGIATAERDMYMSALMENRATALQAYATQIGAMFEQNASVIEQFGADLTAVQTHVDLTYKQLMADIGYDEHLMEMNSEKHEQYMAPYYEEIEAALTALEVGMGLAEINQADQDDISAAWTDAGALALTGAGTGASIGVGVGGPVGALVGGAIGLFTGAILSLGSLFAAYGG